MKTGDWKSYVFALAGIGVMVPLAVGLGIYSFTSAVTTTLYPNAAAVPSVTHDTSFGTWTDAVEQGRQAARAGVVEKNLPGLSVAVGVGSDLVWAEGFGWADLEKKVPVTPAMRFRIGHASKGLTSAGVGLLLEKKKLHLSDDIQTYVPAFPKKEWPVTVRQLMGHVGGVRHYDSEADYISTSHCERASEGVPPFANDPLRFEPQTQSRYSTFGWVLVSAAVEAAAGESFFSFMRGQVFTPLGMADTVPDTGTERLANVTAFYTPRFSGDPAFGPEETAPADYSCFAGAGGFLSTPSDLVRFGMAMNTGKLLRRDTVTTLHTPVLLASGQETQYGLGWTLERVSLAGESTRMASQASRTLLGGSTSFLTFPERALVVAVTSNTSFANTRSIALQIAEAFAERK
jgi:serine beta-lactamase-like protein LACTB, mitochondrial